MNALNYCKQGQEKILATRKEAHSPQRTTSAIVSAVAQMELTLIVKSMQMKEMRRKKKRRIIMEEATIT